MRVGNDDGRPDLFLDHEHAFESRERGTGRQ
jgi:hypothetical protein